MHTPDFYLHLITYDGKRIRTTVSVFTLNSKEHIHSEQYASTKLFHSTPDVVDMSAAFMYVESYAGSVSSNIYPASFLMGFFRIL